jgi:hypothetical protein
MNGTMRTGLAMLYVLAAIALVGGAVYLLTDACGTMAFETRRMYVDACARNLTASGLAWARHSKVGSPGADVSAKSLDAEPLAVPDAGLDVTIRGADAFVSISFRRGRHLVTRRETRRLE